MGKRIEGFKTLHAIQTTFPSVMMYDVMCETAGITTRLHEDAKPEHTSVVCSLSTADLERVRQVTNVIRMGYVRVIAPHYLELDGGRLKTEPGTCYINCSHPQRRWQPMPEPVFTPGRIKLQRLKDATCYDQCHSGATIALVEKKSALNDEGKNRLCQPTSYHQTTAENLYACIPTCCEDLWLQAGLFEARVKLRSCLLKDLHAEEWWDHHMPYKIANHIEHILWTQHQDLMEEHFAAWDEVCTGVASEPSTTMLHPAWKDHGLWALKRVA